MGNAVRSIFYRKFSSQDYFLEDEGESIGREDTKVRVM